MLRVLRRRAADDLAAHAAGKAHPGALHVGAGCSEARQGLGVVANLDADLLQDRVGVVLEDCEPCLADELERGHRACEVRDPVGHMRGPQCLAAGATPGAS